jgi:SPP1 gp7 family putative phage head morphogenesis protein
MLLARRRVRPITNGRIARLDPSRTITLRRQFQRDLSARFNRLRQAVIKLILHDDALGLKQRRPFTFNAEDEPGRWITVRGQHVFIPEGKDAGKAVKEHFDNLKEKNEKQLDLHKDDIARFRVEDLLLDKRAVQHTRGDIDNGRKSHTEGPLDVWKTEDGRYLVVDGYHRVLEGIDRGDKEFDIQVVGEGYTDYWVIPDKDNTYHPPVIKEVTKSLLMPSSTSGPKKTASAISELMIRQTEGHVQGQEVHKRIAAESPYYVLTKVPISSLSRYDDPDVHPNQAHPSKGPIIVSSSGEILDGRHRTAAAKLRGETEIDAWVPIKPPTRNLAANTRWAFHSTEQKLNAFREWLKRQIIVHLVGEHLDENAWWNQYIMDGFRRGAARAFDDTRPQVREWQDSPEAKQRLSFYNGTREEFLRSSFNWPTSREKVKLLASRTFTDLKGVTDGMAARISHTLVDGLTKGDNPKVIARDLAKNVSVGKVRAQAIARTEIIRTHAEGQLDAFERMGVTEVGVMAEWLTAEDDRVCPKCQSLNGVVLKVEEARGLLPRHPSCRCCWTPANVGEDESNQKRSKVSIERAISKSYSKEDSNKSSWGGADKIISKVRPKSILD